MTLQPGFPGQGRTHDVVIVYLSAFPIETECVILRVSQFLVLGWHKEGLRTCL